MSSIWKLVNEYALLEEAAECAPTEEFDVFKDTLEAIEGEIEFKAENLAKVKANLKATVVGLKEEENRITSRRQAIENNIKRIDESLLNAMVTTGKTKFKTNLYSFNVQNNPMSCAIAEGTELPKEYLVEQEPKVNKKQIIADMKAGKTIDGCSLVQTQRVAIR